VANANDPLGIAQDRIQHNAEITARSAVIAAWTGDIAGLLDQKLQNAEANYQVNTFTTASTSAGANMAGTAFAGFGLEKMST
jgi:hypothetical protein